MKILRNFSRCRRGAIPLAMTLALACSPASAFMIQIYGVSFKSGHPKPGESLESALAEPIAEELAHLEFDIRFVKEFPRSRLEVNGFTDDRECRGRACIALSERRAKLVYDWLIARGMPAENLVLGKGYGNLPIDDNAKPEGRARNRRAELNFAKPNE